VSTRWARPVHYALLLLVNAVLFLRPWQVGLNDWRLAFNPIFDALRRIVLHYGQFPWWIPWVDGGTPLFALPEIPVFSPDVLLILAYGSIIGIKLGMLMYAIIGYEGTRALLGHCFRREMRDDGVRRLIVWASVVPVLVPALAVLWAWGAYGFAPFYLFPWLLLLSLTWRRSVGRSLALGLLVGWLLLINLHYVAFVSLTFAALPVLVQVVRGAREWRTWALLALAASAALGLGFTRMALVVQWVSTFPQVIRVHAVHFDWQTVASLLVEPFRIGSDMPLHLPAHKFHWHETGTYVGLAAIVLFLVGLRQAGRWRVRWWHWAAPLVFFMAWNNVSPFSPSSWLHAARPWCFMSTVTRYRLWATFLLLLGAVGGLAAVYRTRARPLAWLLLALLIVDLGGHWHLALEPRIVLPPPRETYGPDPPVTIRGNLRMFWSCVRRNRGCLEAISPVLRWSHTPVRVGMDEPHYISEFYAQRLMARSASQPTPASQRSCGTVLGPPEPAEVRRWSPNHIVLAAPPGSLLTANVNPGSYWLVNGVRYWPHWRATEPARPFQVWVPRSGLVDLRIDPPHVRLFLTIQAACAALAVALFCFLQQSRGDRAP
jgi:hypothetical protein